MKSCPIFYFPTHYQVHERYTLPTPILNHIKACRVQNGSPILCFNGQEEAHGIWRDQQFYVQSIHKTVRPSFGTELGMAMIKADKFEWVVQKAVEIGALSIRPLITERVNYHLDFTKPRWQQIIRSACEQSRRTHPLQIHPTTPLADWLADCHSNYRWFGCLAGHTWQNFVPIQHLDAQSILIGPEGGLTAAEQQAATNAGFQAVCLGPWQLRAETAALTALSLFQLPG